MTNRVLYLDSLRGVTILLVVVGHLIQYNYNAGLQNPIFNIIYSFHMPLFFFLSGCTRSLSKNIKGVGYVGIVDCVKEIWHKFVSLIVPSVVWTILVPLFFQNEIEFRCPVSSYWFLNVLFAISVLWIVISYVYNRINRKWIVVLLVVLGVSMCYVLNVYRIPLTYFCAFALGYIWQQHSLSDKVPSFVILLLSIIFLLTVGQYQYGNTLSGNPDRVWLLLPLSTIASIVLHWIFHKNVFNNKLITLLGKFSLGIYMCHYMFIRLPFVSHIQNDFTNIQQFVILLIFALVISCVCVGIQIIVSQINWLDGLLYGNWKFLKRIKK